jgi:hypothetical protein
VNFVGLKLIKTHGFAHFRIFACKSTWRIISAFNLCKETIRKTALDNILGANCDVDVLKLSVVIVPPPIPIPPPPTVIILPQYHLFTPYSNPVPSISYVALIWLLSQRLPLNLTLSNIHFNLQLPLRRLVSC